MFGLRVWTLLRWHLPKTSVLERHPHPTYPRLRIELRSDSRFFQAVTRLDDKLRQKTTGTDNLPTALRIAEDWYRRELKASQLAARQHPIDLVLKDPTMAEVYASYARTLEGKAATYADGKWSPIAGFWRTQRLSTINAATFREFYAWRRKNFRKFGKQHQLSNSTLHKDKILIRQFLNHAIDKGWLSSLPLIPKSGKIVANPRPWFDAQEWRKLTAVSRKRMQEAKRNPKVYQQRKDLDDLIHFMYGSMFRVGEAVTNLRFKDCRVEKNRDGAKMLLIKLHEGKRGARTVVGTREAAEVFEDRLSSASDPNARIFPERKVDAFRELLIAAGLRTNEQGFKRNWKSLRATSISTRILDQPDLNLLFIGRNAGVSLATIDNFYAKRLTAEMKKNELSAVKPFSRDSSLQMRKVQRQVRKERREPKEP
jgi:hypothetical protein